MTSLRRPAAWLTRLLAAWAVPEASSASPARLARLLAAWAVPGASSAYPARLGRLLAARTVPGASSASPARLARLLAAWTVLGALSASPLQARPCLGFSGQGFLGASGAVRREWSEKTPGIGGSGGLRVGRVAAAGHLLRFPGIHDHEESGFESARVTLAYELPASSLSLCPVMTSGIEAVSSRDSSRFPYRTASFFGAGLAVGHTFTATDSDVTFVPWLSASIENPLVERLFEGDILLADRETTVVLRGGVTTELGRLFVRPYLALLAVENGWLTGGATVGVRF